MKFRFNDFNHVRYARGADAARVEVTEDNGTGHLLWMSTQDIKKNVMLFGPHLGLLQAANSYNLNVRALVASWRAGGDKKFLNPMDPARPRDGWWRHPDWPVEERDEVMKSWLTVIGYEIDFAWLEHDEDAEDVQTRWENGDTDILAWQPKPPAGDGWFIVSIHDHEDGPVCVWARDKGQA
jgi:hypothetical protein